MANDKLILVNVNFDGNQVKKMVLENLASDPAYGKEGMLYANTTTHKARYHDGTQWTDIGALQSIRLKDGETILNLNVTDPANPVLSTKISATQGDAVSVTAETDGLKVAVDDATTEQKGIVQLLTPESDEDWERDDVAITPLGASASKVTIDDSTTTMGYLKSYEFYQGNELIGTVDIPKDFLLKNAKVKVTVAFDAGETYEEDDLVVYNSKLYRALETFGPADFDPTKFVEITTLPADVGMTVMIFIVNVKDESETSQYLYVNFNQLAQTYSADEVTLHKDNNNVFSLKEIGDAVTEEGLYKFRVNEYGQVIVADEPEAIKTTVVVSDNIDNGNDSVTITLPVGSTFVGYYTEQDGVEVVTDVQVTRATDSSAGTVVFSTEQAVSDVSIICEVTYLAK